MTALLAEIMAYPDIDVCVGTEEAASYFKDKHRATALVVLDTDVYKISRAGAHCEIQNMRRAL